MSGAHNAHNHYSLQLKLKILKTDNLSSTFLINILTFLKHYHEQQCHGNSRSTLFLLLYWYTGYSNQHDWHTRETNLHEERNTSFQMGRMMADGVHDSFHCMIFKEFVKFWIWYSVKYWKALCKSVSVSHLLCFFGKNISHTQWVGQTFLHRGDKHLCW